MDVAGGRPFMTGAKVEVTSDEDGFQGAWFEATVVRTLPRARQYTVEYDSLLDDAGVKRLRETVEWRHVRPRPSAGGDGIAVDGAVDAYCKDAWWTGVLVKVGGKRKAEEKGGRGGGERYTVYFPGSDEVMEFGEGEVRAHWEWVDGEWVDPRGKENHKIERGFGKALQGSQQLDTGFCVGSLVELSSDEEGFIGSWFDGIIIEPRSNNNFLVEYPDLRTDDGKELLREVVPGIHIRPRPPKTKPSSFKKLEEVDARHNDGWWVGVVSEVLQGNRYMIYFKQSGEELEFSHHDLRLHFDWMKGKWCRGSQELGF